MNVRNVAFLLSSFLVVCRASADEPVTIKLRDDGAVGDRYVTKRVTTEKGTTTFGDKESAESKEEREEYTSEILGQPDEDGRPTKLRRTYKVAVETTNGEKQDLPFSGKTLIIEKKDKLYTFRIENGNELTKDDIPDLYRKFNERYPGPRVKDSMLMPKKPVRVGDEWTVDQNVYMKSLGGDIPFLVDEKTSRVKGRLLKVYEKDGQKWGSIRLTVNLDVVELNLQGSKLPAKKGSKISVTGNLERCIDGTHNSEIDETVMDMQIEAELPGLGDLKINSKHTEKLESIHTPKEK